MNKLTLSITMFFVLTSLFALPVYAGPALERSEGTWTETTFVVPSFHSGHALPMEGLTLAEIL
jgi:hypothetical protein